MAHSLFQTQDKNWGSNLTALATLLVKTITAQGHPIKVARCAHACSLADFSSCAWRTLLADFSGPHSQVPLCPGGAALLAALPPMQARCLHHNEDSYNGDPL